jgi:hypothetical protein
VCLREVPTLEFFMGLITNIFHIITRSLCIIYQAPHIIYIERIKLLCRPPRQICVPWRHPAPCSGARPGPGPAGPRRMAPPRRLYITRSPVVFSEGDDNDPSAGSPTETLLRLLLPLNDKVQWTSRDVTGGGPPASPRSEHFTGPFNR